MTHNVSTWVKTVPSASIVPAEADNNVQILDTAQTAICSENFSPTEDAQPSENSPSLMNTFAETGEIPTSLHNLAKAKVLGEGLGKGLGKGLETGRETGQRLKRATTRKLESTALQMRSQTSKLDSEISDVQSIPSPELLQAKNNLKELARQLPTVGGKLLSAQDSVMQAKQKASQAEDHYHTISSECRTVSIEVTKEPDNTELKEKLEELRREESDSDDANITAKEELKTERNKLIIAKSAFSMLENMTEGLGLVQNNKCSVTDEKLEVLKNKIDVRIKQLQELKYKDEDTKIELIMLKELQNNCNLAPDFIKFKMQANKNEQLYKDMGALPFLGCLVMARRNSAQKNAPKRLTDCEMVAVYRYTTGDYKKMNEHMRGTAKKDKALQVCCEHATRGLKKLPDISYHDGMRIRRGIINNPTPGTNDWENAALPIGGTYVDHGITSCTTGEVTTCHLKLEFKGTHNVKDLGDFSTFNESEVVIVPGTEYIVELEDKPGAGANYILHPKTLADSHNITVGATAQRNAPTALKVQDLAKAQQEKIAESKVNLGRKEKKKVKAKSLQKAADLADSSQVSASKSDIKNFELHAEDTTSNLRFFNTHGQLGTKTDVYFEPTLAKMDPAKKQKMCNDFGRDFGLHMAEKRALATYTTGAYRLMNHKLSADKDNFHENLKRWVEKTPHADLMRKGTKKESIAQALEGVDELITLTASGLNKLPSYDGSVYRGCRLTQNEIDAYVNAHAKQEGVVRIEWKFNSTTKNRGRAESFTGWDPKPDNFPVLFEYEPPITGKDIEQISTTPVEEEVLFNFGAVFQSTNVRQDDSGTYIITMRQVFD